MLQINNYNELNEDEYKISNNRFAKLKIILLFIICTCVITNTLILVYFSYDIPYQLNVFNDEFESSINLFKNNMDSIIIKTNKIYNDISIFCNKSQMC